MFSAERRLLVCNEQYAQIYSLPPELTKPGTTLEEIFSHRTSAGPYARDFCANYMRELRQAIENKVPAVKIMILRDGRTIIIRHHPLENGGWLATHEDITNHRHTQAWVAYLSSYDELTGLANRRFLMQEIESALRHPEAGLRVATLCVDVDGFKQVNDALGHARADDILKLVAQRLRTCVAAPGLPARLGADEFAVFFLAADPPKEAEALARQVIKAMAVPCTVIDQEVLVRVSVGIALAPADGSTADELLKNAHLAVSAGKTLSRGSYCFFEPEMNARMQSRGYLERELRKALVNGELRIEYQPLIALSTNRISSCEALLRWDHPHLGLVAPSEFIPIAEATGMILPIGEWALRQACTEAATWPEAVKVAVNVSVAQFKSRDLTAKVIGALSSSGLRPDRLELEITETVLLDEGEATLTQLKQLHALGVRIALDDFGTGYSSLRYLRVYPFDKIKIDRCFVTGDDEESQVILRAIAGLGRSLGIATTAEGVETSAQLDLVRSEGCTEAQGYFFSKPRASREIANMLLAEAPLRTEFERVRGNVQMGTPDSSSATRQPCTDSDSDEGERLKELYDYQILDTPPEESFERIARLAKVALNAPMAMVSFVDEERQWFKARQGISVQETHRDASFCAHTIKEDRALVVRDARADPRFSCNPLVVGEPHVRAYLGVPLRTPTGKSIGAVCIKDVEPRDVTSAEISILHDLARLVMDELELRKLAMVDGLTGALTKRAFIAEGDREVRRARRNRGSLLSCIMFDIDHFKSINDQHGHATGDRVLCSITELCKHELRGDDRIGRLGGEEFGISLPGKDVSSAILIAKRLRRSMQLIPITDASAMVRVTASFGVVQFDAADRNMDEMIHRADGALYEAKSAGRDRIVARHHGAAAT